MITPMIRKNENGFVTVLAIISIAVFSILLVGLLNFSMTITKSTAFTRDRVSAQYAAEAGLKRAIVGMQQGRIDWGWLGGNQNNRVTGDAAEVYNVTIKLLSGTANISDGKAPVAGTYQITAVGRSGKIKKTASVEAVITTSSSGGALTGDTVYVAADVKPKNNMTLNGTIAYGGSILGGTISGDGGKKENQTKVDPDKMTFPEYDFKQFKSDAGAKPLDVSSIKMNNNTLPSAKTYVDGPFYLGNSSQNVTLDVPSGANGVLFINGDLTVLGNNFKISGNIMLVVKGSVYFKNRVNLANAIIVADGDVEFKNGADFGGSIVAKGSLLAKNNDNIDRRPGLTEAYNVVMAAYTNAGSSKLTVTTQNWSDGSN